MYLLSPTKETIHPQNNLQPETKFIFVKISKNKIIYHFIFPQRLLLSYFNLFAAYFNL